jgi:hypothetical protein
MWDWIPGPEPDGQLWIVTKDSWCSWSDTGWDNPPTTSSTSSRARPSTAKRRAIIYRMQKMVYDAWVYTQLTNHVALDATVDEVDRLQEPAERVLEDVLHEPEEGGLSLTDGSDRERHP